MDTVELKVNVINQLRLLRQSTFKDILCFLDEDIQNAQRAKATDVKITVSQYLEKSVTIENNGAILTNPQALFSIAESGWDDEVKNTENPFGMGFFSNITVSNFIQIYSGNLLVTFDVEKMINTNDTTIQVEEVADYYDGFKLVLSNFDFETVKSWDIDKRAEVLGKYTQELDIYINGELQAKKKLTEGDNSKFQLAIEDETFSGWIALGSNYSWESELNIFYKGRLVCKLDGTPYLKGDLHVTDKTLNLTSPDRKGIIQDSKLVDFKLLVKLYAEKLCNSTLMDNSDNTVDNFTSCIAYYINKKEIKNLIKFMTFKSKSEKDMDYLSGIALAKSTNKINSFKEYSVFLKKENAVQSESHFEEVGISAKVVSEPKEPIGEVYHDSYSTSGSYHSGYTEKLKIEKDELDENLNSIIFSNKEPIFYIGFADIVKNEMRLNAARHYNLKIIVAKNKVEEDILKEMKDSDNVRHISELDETVTVTGTLSNTILDTKEQRALMLLDMIGRIVGFDYNVFAIGDLMVIKNVTIETLEVSEQIVDENVVVLKDDIAKKIYIDRSIINKDNLRNDIEENLDVNDYKFILSNFQDIIQQLGLLTHKGEKEYERQIMLALSI